LIYTLIFFVTEEICSKHAHSHSGTPPLKVLKQLDLVFPGPHIVHQWLEL